MKLWGHDQDVLVLSGDTHGGQVLLPAFLWRYLRKRPGTDRVHGLFRKGRKSQYVTSGIGSSGLPVRFGVRPEVVILELLE